MHEVATYMSRTLQGDTELTGGVTRLQVHITNVSMQGTGQLTSVMAEFAGDQVQHQM